MVVGLEVVDDMLPVGRQDIPGRPLQALVDLIYVNGKTVCGTAHALTLAQVPVYNSATGAYPCAES